MIDYTKLKTPMQAIRAIEALGTDFEGDIIIPGYQSGKEGDLVRALRRLIRENRGTK